MPEKPLLILLIGLPGTGKSTLADEIIKKFSPSFYSMDKDKYSEILQTTKMPLLFEIFVKIGWLSPPKINQDTIYDLMLHAIPNKNVVMQGNFAERINLNKMSFDKFAKDHNICIIHMKCDPNVRRQRIESRDAQRDKTIITNKNKFIQSTEKRIVTEKTFIDSIEEFIFNNNGNYLEIFNDDDSKIDENFKKVEALISKVFNSSEPAPKTPSPIIEQFPPKMSPPPFYLDQPEDRGDTSAPESTSIPGTASMTKGPLLFSLRDNLAQTSSHPAERSLLQKRTSAPAMNI